MSRPVAIIPARGGSRRVPRKNIRTFAGRPMLSYSLEAARSCGLFERILVSTDSPEIAELAVELGAEAPFLRPASLAGDDTPTAPVVRHALEWLAEDQGLPESFCLIYATAPFLRGSDLRRGYELLRARGTASVFSVTSFAFPIFRALRREEDGRVSMFWPEHELTRSQDLPEAFHDAGQFYWLDTSAFLRDGRLYTRDALGVLLPRYRVQDIDTPEDWEHAEAMFEALARGAQAEDGD